MFRLKSNDIRDFPFEEYSKLNLSELEQLSKTHRLREYNSWMLPQIVAYLATWQLYKTDSGKICPRQTSQRNIVSPWQIGLWRVITQLKRSSLVKQQIDPQYTNYSALVPLILSAHKRYNGVGYNHWQVDEGCWLVEKNLLQAMLWQPSSDDMSGLDHNGWLINDETNFGLSVDRLYYLRTRGLATAEGQPLSPTSTWCLRNMRGTELENAPKLVGTMLTQIWVAHPSLRTQYMILDPMDWDRMPEPLIDGQLFKTPKKLTVTEELPWL